MRLYKLFLAVLTAFFIVSGVNGQGGVERHLRAIENLQTDLHFIYRNTYTPVADITYHEFSADSITWRKEYQDGDCYIRFSNKTNNSTNPYTGYQGYHADSTWWVFNFCTCNGALDSLSGGSGIDTLFITYYNGDTVSIIDTTIVTGNTLNIRFTEPDTVSGSSINNQDTLYHTHELYVFMGDLEDVDTTGLQDGYVLKWNAVNEMWELAPDLSGGGASLTVSELDGAPDVSNVNEIVVTNSHLTDLGTGRVFLDLTLDPVNGVNDYWRTDTVRVGSGDTFLEFSSALSDTDYIVASLYATLDDGNRQDLQYDSITVNGFKALNVIDSAWVHYIAIRDVDSLLSSIADIGKVYASATDGTLGYLSQSVDDSTITVTNDELTVINSPDADSLGGVVASEYLTWSDTTAVDGVGVATAYDLTQISSGTDDQTLSIDSAYNGSVKTHIVSIEDGNSVSFKDSVLTTAAVNAAESDPVYAADSASIVWWKDTTAVGNVGIATAYDLSQFTASSHPDTTRVRAYASTMTIDYDTTRTYYVNLSGHINKLTIDNVVDGAWGTVEISPNGYGIDTIAFEGYDLTVYETGAAPDSAHIDTSAQFLTINWQVTDSAGYVSFPLVQYDTTIYVIQAVWDSTDIVQDFVKVFYFPDDFILTGISATCLAAPTTSGLTIDVHEAGTTIMTTNKISIDATETDSEDAGTQPVITDANIARKAKMTIEIDAEDSGDTATGLWLFFEGIRQ